MINKKLIISLIISIILTVIVTMIIFLSSISLSSMVHCLCGGCCVGCPGDCNAIGAPFAFYYWGINDLSGEAVNQLSAFGLITDIIVWLILMFLIYKFIYKKKEQIDLRIIILSISILAVLALLVFFYFGKFLMKTT